MPLKNRYTDHARKHISKFGRGLAWIIYIAGTMMTAILVYLVASGVDALIR